MDIAITTSDSVMYKVGKVSNDFKGITFFVYNNGSKESDKYGQFVIVKKYGIYVQDEETFGLELATAEEAAEKISDSPATVAAVLRTLQQQAESSTETE